MADFIRLSTTIQYRVDHSEVSSMTQKPTGMISKYIREITNEVRVVASQLTARGANSARNYAARHGAPARTGPRLKDSYAVTPRHFTPNETTWAVSNNRPYAYYVFAGHRPSNKFQIVGLSQTSWRRVYIKGEDRDKRIPPLHLKGGVDEQKKARGPVKGYAGRNYPLEAVVGVYRGRGL